MTLKNKFKTDTTAANEGVWFDYEDAPNEDGTVPGFKLARKTGQNKAYGKAMREFTKEHTTDEGIVDMSSLPEAEAEAVELGIFTEALLLDWRNFQPDEDGKEVKYSKEEAKRIFGDPDWSDLYKDLAVKCGKSSAYKAKQRKAEAKNS